MTFSRGAEILLVDDSEDDVDATKRAFRRANLCNPIHHEYNGQAALEYLHSRRDQQPCMILLDLNMPGIDGRRVLEHIKHDPELRQIPVIILTTSSDERDVKSCYELGANTYIQKPVDFDGLIDAIKRLKEYWFEIAILPKSGDEHD